MSARFFGEYLVQKGVIRPESLVSALIEQMAKLPLVSQIVYENSWLPADKMIQVFHLQQEKGEDFVTACRTLGVWDDKIASRVDEFLKKERIPVGQILVQRGDLDIKTLTRSLDDFLAQAEVHSTAPAMTPSPVEVPEEEMLQPGIIAELEDMFDERKRRAIKVALAFIKDKNQPDAVQMTKLMQDSLKIIRTILGLVKLFGLTSLQTIFQEMERVLELRMHASAFSMEQMQEVAEKVGLAMEEAWHLRESICANCTDTFYMKDVEAKKRFEKILAQLKDIT